MNWWFDIQCTFFLGICTNILKIKINGENIQMLNFKLREVALLFSKFPVIYLGPDHLVTSLHTGTFDSNFSHTCFQILIVNLDFYTKTDPGLSWVSNDR